MDSPVLKTLYYVVMTLGERDTKKRKLVSERTLKVFDSDKFKSDMADRVLFGFPSHYNRRDISLKQKETKLPYFDLVIDSGDYCNVITGCKRIKDSIVLKIDILDNEPGRKIMNLYNSGTKLRVSLAMISDPTAKGAEQEWVFDRVMGLDFTTNPAFVSAREVEENFSTADEDLNIFTLEEV